MTDGQSYNQWLAEKAAAVMQNVIEMYIQSGIDMGDPDVPVMENNAIHAVTRDILLKSGFSSRVLAALLELLTI